MTADLRVLPDGDALAAAVAAEVARRLGVAAGERGAATIALGGGRTPRAFFRRLATTHHDDVPWERVHVFWGDERDVPLGDERSNYRMARETLLAAVPVPPAQVHPMPAGSDDPAAAAVAYEDTLRACFGAAAEWPAFDLVLLGLGEDGHTASLFPGSPALDERRRWVVPATAPVEPRPRLTLTLPALTSARALFVVVAGPEKAQPLYGVLALPPDPARPASLLRRGPAPVTWWADAAAAALVAGR